MAENLDVLARKKVNQYTKPGPAGFIAFCKECVRIPAGDTESSMFAVPFKLWPEQERAACIIAVERLIIWLKARQVGATFVILAFMLFRALFWLEQEFLIVSLNEKEAKKSIDRLKAMIANLPEWCQPELEICNTTTIKFAHTGSVIEAQASTINAGRGRTPSGLLVDEDAYQLYGKKIIDSALPGMEKRKGWLWRVSTGNGMGNDFERGYHLAEQKKSNFTPIFLPWSADPSRDQAWYDSMTEKHGREYMMEVYPRNSTEAFLASGRPFFDQERIATDISDGLPPFQDGYIEAGKFVPAANGYLRVWEAPKPNTRYVMFSDVAEGLEDGDFCNAYVVPVGRSPRHEVARVRGKMDPGELADVLQAVGEWYSHTGQDADGAPALLAVEANNMGILTNDVLRSRGYLRLYQQRDLQTGVVSDRIGWLTTGGARGTRKLMLGKLQDGYRRGTEKVVDRDCLEEMGNFFHRGPLGKAQVGPGQHDDCIISRAGACALAGMESVAGDAEPPSTLSERDQAIRDSVERMNERRAAMNYGVQELGG
jgi:hypothetical protein